MDALKPPPAFPQHNQAKYQRTIQLTRQAIAQLQAERQTVTLAAVVEATRAFTESGKGLTATTILRNPDTAALFHQHSPAYQQRQRVQSARLQPAPAPATSSPLAVADLNPLVEALKKQVAELQVQQATLKSERDEAYRLRDEVLQQNTRQLAMLAQLTAKLERLEAAR